MISAALRYLHDVVYLQAPFLEVDVAAAGISWMSSCACQRL